MNINNLTIKHKLVLSLVLAVLSAISLVGYISHQQAKQVIEHRLLNTELPATLMQFNKSVEQEISVLLAASEQLASSPALIHLVQASQATNTDQPILNELRALKQQYNLIDASIANRVTGRYWMDSFDAAKQHKPQGWFRTLITSGKEKSLSLYREDNGDMKLFINYQQANGVALAGISKSINGMVDLINQFTLEQSGFVFLVNGQGTIQIHHRTPLLGRSLQAEYSSAVSNQLMNKAPFSVATFNRNGETILVSSSYIPSMDWYVVAELPQEEAFAELDQTRQQIMLWTIAIAALFALLGVCLGSSITKPIARLASVFKELGEGDGDLRHRIDINGNDEIAQLSEGFNSFITKIHRSVSDVAETGNALRDAAESVAQQANETLTHSHSQRDRTLQMVAAINQMGATVNEIAANAAQAADAAYNANTETQSGQQVVGQARETINQLSNDIAQVSDVIDSLANNTLAIGSILDVIRGISDQTNLLALNAAIEAARAGEQGRGFAVVADEVRNLASRTAASTDEIQTMINQLQQEASNAVNAIGQSSRLTSEGVCAADTASGSLVSIADRITLISDMNTQVATATEEQSSVVNEINGNIEEINETTQRTADTAAELAQSSQSLRDLSKRLDDMVGTFKL